MRVGLVTTLQHGGPIEHALLLARGLAGRGASVTAVCAGEAVAARFVEAGATAIVIPFHGTYEVRQALRVRRALRGSDVVHSHDRRSGLWCQLLPRPTVRSVRVHTVHGIADPYLPEPIGTAEHALRDRFAYEFVEPLAARRVDALVVPSRAVADDLVDRLGWPRRAIEVVPNGVDVWAMPFMPRTGPYVGTVSRLDPFKGLDVFLRAAALVRDAMPETRFLIPGTGAHGPALSELSVTLGLGDSVEWPGHVPAESAFRRLRVFALSSYWENAPIALLEAMALGVPVVATTVAGVPEIATSATAQLVPPGDPPALASAVLRLLRDPALARRQAEAARKMVEMRFSSDANVGAILELYGELIMRRRGHS